MKKEISWKVALIIIIPLIVFFIIYIFSLKNNTHEDLIKVIYESKSTDLGKVHSKEYTIRKNGSIIKEETGHFKKIKKISSQQIEAVMSKINSVEKERHLIVYYDIYEFYYCVIDGIEYTISKEDWESLVKYLDNLIK